MTLAAVGARVRAALGRGPADARPGRGAARPRCAVSVDVDGLDCYYRIHALGAPPRALDGVILERALPRFGELLARWGIPATFFLVARDFDPAPEGARDFDPAPEGGGQVAPDEAEPEYDVRAARALVAELAAAGHEIGNHSYSHPYDLARFDEGRAGAEIERAHELLSALAGRPVRGFRAPGYDLSAAMLGHLERLGYAYDSSIFPAPGYYAAKAAVMAALALLGRPSGAVLTDPRALAAPPVPYRPDPRRPWRRGRAGLVELPIAVTPVSRVPAIGTSLLLAPDPVRAHLLRAMRRRPLFNFELHGIDLIDADLDHIPLELVARQPDLRVPLAVKLGRLEAALGALARHFEFVSLAEAATEVAAAT